MSNKPIPSGSVYPTHRLSPSGPTLSRDLLVRQGYDAIVEDLVLPPTSLVPLTVIPRNLAADPLEVAFPDFNAGDILEVDCRISGIPDDQVPEAAINALVLVSLDGGTKFYVAAPSTGPQAIKQNVVGNNGVATTLFWGAVIADPMPIFSFGGPIAPAPLDAPPIIRIWNLSDVSLSVGGVTDPFACGAVWLKCAQFLGGKKGVFQSPPGTLFDIL
jgi:hypothetical protein